MYLVVLNLLINNQLNSSLRHIVVTIDMPVGDWIKCWIWLLHQSSSTTFFSSLVVQKRWNRLFLFTENGYLNQSSFSQKFATNCSKITIISISKASTPSTMSICSNCILISFDHIQAVRSRLLSSKSILYSDKETAYHIMWNVLSKERSFE